MTTMRYYRPPLTPGEAKTQPSLALRQTIEAVASIGKTLAHRSVTSDANLILYMLGSATAEIAVAELMARGPQTEWERRKNNAAVSLGMEAFPSLADRIRRAAA